MTGFVLEADGGRAPYPNVSRWFDELNARPTARRAVEPKTRFAFREEMDEQAMRAMFPQNS